MARWTAPLVIEDEWDRYERFLRQKGRKRKTIDMNRDGFERLVRFAIENHSVADIEDFRRDHVNSWVEHMRDVQNVNPQSLCIYYRTARPFFNWWADDDEYEDRVSPFRRAISPPEPDNPVPVLELEDITAMIRQCVIPKCALRSVRLVALRDRALIRVFFGIGPRRGEVHGMEVEDWNPKTDQLHIRQSKTYTRTLVVSDKAAADLDAYLRERARQEIKSKYLWVNYSGHRLTEWGIAQAIARCGQNALGRRIKPQHFRHTHAHQFLLNDGQENDLVRTMGWTNSRMVGRYGKSAADERARKAQRSLALGDMV